MPTIASVNEEDNRSETASSGYASVQGTDEPALEEHTAAESKCSVVPLVSCGINSTMLLSWCSENSSNLAS